MADFITGNSEHTKKIEIVSSRQNANNMAVEPAGIASCAEH